MIIAYHNATEEKAAGRFAAGPAAGLAACEVLREEKHNELMGKAINFFKETIDPSADDFEAKRQILCLARRGGKGKPEFVDSFTKGAGTTCGEWTRPMIRHKDGTVTKGFMKAAVAVGFCPVECPFCYLQMPYTDGMTINLNLEDLATELKKKWMGYD